MSQNYNLEFDCYLKSPLFLSLLSLMSFNAILTIFHTISVGYILYKSKKLRTSTNLILLNSFICNSINSSFPYIARLVSSYCDGYDYFHILILTKSMYTIILFYFGIYSAIFSPC